MVPAHSINAPLRGIGQNIFKQRRLPNSFRDVFFTGKGLASLFVLDELDRQQQPEPANFDDIPVPCDGLQLSA